MEIILKKDHMFVIKVVPKGTKVKVTNSLARDLIAKGIARPLNFIDTTIEKTKAIFEPKDKEYAVNDISETKPKSRPDYTKQTPEAKKGSLTKKGKIKDDNRRS